MFKMLVSHISRKTDPKKYLAASFSKRAKSRMLGYCRKELKFKH
jgi:hypothetical protein